MYNLELCQHIFRDMKRHKVRSILAMLGIIWGTVAVVMLLALGEGFYLANEKNMMGFADGTILVIPHKSSKIYQSLPPQHAIEIKAADVFKLKAVLPVIRLISPILEQTQTISFKQQQMLVTVRGVAPSYSVLSQKYPENGSRFISPIDITKQQQVIFLDS